jgi:hypothetical protein
MGWLSELESTVLAFLPSSRTGCVVLSVHAKLPRSG